MADAVPGLKAQTAQMDLSGSAAPTKMLQGSAEVREQLDKPLASGVDKDAFDPDSKPDESTKKCSKPAKPKPLLPGVPKVGKVMPPKVGGKGQPGDKMKRAAAAKAVFPGQQNYNNCGVQSSEQIINQATGKKVSEKDLLTKSIDKGWANNGDPDPMTYVFMVLKVGNPKIPVKAGGTSPKGRKKILDEYGVPSSTTPYSRDAMAKAIWEKKGVIASIHTDGASWWKDSSGKSMGSGKHAIVVTDGEFDKNGNLTDVYVNDTGVGKQVKVPIADFEKATAAHDSPTLNITDKPIWP